MLSKNIGKVVLRPWFNKQEWEEVFSKLYSSNRAEKQWAVERVAVWDRRIHPNLSLSIDVTAQLVNATIQDEMNSKTTVFYSMAIIKFVNLITDKVQNISGPISVKSAAKHYGIPEWLLDLRHKATHGNSPSLDMLRVGAKFALQWLRENYWIPEGKKIHDAILNSSFIRRRISKKLKKYQKFSDKSLKEFNINDELECSELKKKFGELKILIKQNRDIFLEILCGTRQLLPPSFHLKELEKTDEAHFLVSECLQLPIYIQSIWKPLIIFLNQRRMLQEMLECLLVLQSKYTSLTDRIIISWALLLLTPPEKQKENSLIHELNPIPLWDWVSLLRCTLKSPSKYATSILPLIIESVEPPLLPCQKDKIMSLVAIYFGSLSNSNSLQFESDSQVICTLEDLESIFHSIQVVKDQDSNPLVWRKCSEEFSIIPFGIICSKSNLESEVSDDSEDENEVDDEEMEERNFPSGRSSPEKPIDLSDTLRSLMNELRNF